MVLKIRPWRIDDAVALSELLNNEKILNNLRDGLPFPYTVTDAEGYITNVLNSDTNSVFAFAVEFEGQIVGSVGVFRQTNIQDRKSVV